jgi:hypothetical protein
MEHTNQPEFIEGQAQLEGCAHVRLAHPSPSNLQNLQLLLKCEILNVDISNLVGGVVTGRLNGLTLNWLTPMHGVVPVKTEVNVRKILSLESR